MNTNTISADARVWLYPANRELTEEESLFVKAQMAQFIYQWTAHGKALSASFELKDQQFLILMADEKAAEASGCSIDASTRFISELGKQIGIDFFDRSKCWAKNESGEKWAFETLKAKKAIEEGKLQADSVLFNPMISRVSDLETNWEIKASESWLARYF